MNKASASRRNVTATREAGTITVSLNRSEYQDHVSAADAVAMDKGVSHARSTRYVGDVVEVALWIRIIEINSGRNYPMTKNQTGRYDLHRCGCSEGMAAERLDR